MPRFAPEITDYLDQFRRGDTDNAFHGLLELDRDVLPELMADARTEPDIRIREFLVGVIWQYRDPSVIPFLGDMLSDSEPRMWQQALNGLVTLASPASLEVLRAARTRSFPTPQASEEFRRWLEEAIEQAATGAPKA